MKMPGTVIREEIQSRGVISFARFMELALYCPETGYYEKNQDSVGRAGDFITSVSTGGLFGELLAFQFAEWLQELPVADCRLPIVEAGAHDGKLAADILRWLKEFRPELFSKIEYVILEPSPTRQAWQKRTLKDFPNARWLASFPDTGSRTPDTGFAGIIFSNELLDAFPVRRFGWDAKGKEWFEWGVTVAGEKFAWARMASAFSHVAQASSPAGSTGVPPGVGAGGGTPPQLAAGTDCATRFMERCSALPSSIRHLPSSLLDVLPDGYILEDSPAAENWWRSAAGVLQRGKLLAIDYGFTAEGQLSPARRDGTLRAFHRHRVSDDLLAHPGEQDLTAHVNFSAIQNAGEAAGLRTEQFCTQPQFLTRVLQKAVTDKSFADWNAPRARQFQTLTHPEHLGRAFRVLVQGK
jgi:SAM-dependent MidA family methyltransferase